MRSAWQHHVPEAVADMSAGDGKGYSGDKELFDLILQQIKKDRAFIAYVAPRGIGPSASSADVRRQVQVRRRYMLLGQTLDSMRVWDIRRACEAVREIQGKRASTSITLESAGSMGVNVVYASLFEPGIGRLVLGNLPRTHRAGPDYLNVLRVLDVPQAVAMAAERSTVEVFGEDTSVRDYSESVAKKLGWREDRLKSAMPAAAVTR